MSANTRLMVVGVAALALLSGCQTDRQKQERQALWTQNQELQAELDAKRAALDAAEGERANLMSQIASLQNELSSSRSTPAQASSAGATGFESIAGVETERRAGSIAVKVPGDVLFASGKVELKTTAQKTLGQIAAVIKREYAGKNVRIEGYTDTDPIRKSKWKDNLELSLERSAAVHRYLQSKGINARNMYAAGFGEWHPRDSKARSRRVEIVVVLNE
ncbi:MAG: OmpA family protein [Phycisphaeraceae bacterium]|nr:OmpA family protein [Phycisphaeraceae bacterium]